ncbi:MAG: hypothetical protein J1F65_02695 [Clostridiales bacterium]|nr:hypothetical protein [Clostridiales bacterium]
MKKKDRMKERKIVKERKPMSSKDKLMLACLVTLVIYLGIMLPVTLCVSAVSWHWFVFGLIVVLIPFAFIHVRLIIQEKVPMTLQQQKNANVSTMKNILYFVLLDCFYMVSFNRWLAWTYILGIIVLARVLYVLAMVFLHEREKNIVFDVGLIAEFLIGLGITVYLIYLIPERFDNLQTIVTAVVAAVYGGLLTLIGVAWTIRQQEKIRQDEEKKKYRPVVVVTIVANQESKAIPLTEFPENKISYTKSEALSYETYINPIIIRNTEFTPFYIYGIMVDDICVLTEIKIYIDRGGSFVISCEQQFVYTKDEIHSIALLTQDLLGNFYKIPMTIEKFKSREIGMPLFRQGVIRILNREISQIKCKDEMPAIELENFALKED